MEIDERAVTSAPAEPASPWTRLGILGDNPIFTAAAGAGCIATSGVLVRLSDAPPVTVAIFRCLYALPFLGVLALWESRRLGSLAGRARNLAWIAGLFFALDLVLWHHAIAAVGAGLATVLGNLQVLIVGFAAWLLLGERPSRGLFVAVPVVLVGVVLISGVVGADAYGDDPLAGVVYGALTSMAYAGFLLVLRQGSSDLRRVAGPLFHATAMAALASFLFGLFAGQLEAPDGVASHGWLLALAVAAQVAGWLLISISLPRLPAAVTSVILLLQPVGAMVLAKFAVDEQPSLVQILGAGLILAGVITAARSRAPASDGEMTPAEARAAP
ncbi:MAG TPA: DMT family transporter [Actinomycetota bacterium]|jgi:drug/metabolite transporter (DMT)-like permease